MAAVSGSSPKGRLFTKAPMRDLTKGHGRNARMLAAALGNDKENKPITSFYHKPSVVPSRITEVQEHHLPNPQRRQSFPEKRRALSLSPLPPPIPHPNRGRLSFTPNNYSIHPPPPKRSKTDSPEGFINLGNTCYLNAVLQSLLSLRCFALDIVQSHRESPSISNHSLFRMLFLLVKAKYSGSDLKSQIILIKDIRRIICERARNFFGFNEQDAHELLTHCLSMLRSDISFLKESKIFSLCPVEINFRSSIEQNLECSSCHHIVTKCEELLDLSLHFTSGSRSSLQELLEDYFKTEVVEYKCHSCSHSSCTLSRRISVLPRVLILTLKRYSLNDYGSFDKKLEPVRIPRHLNLAPVSKREPLMPSPYDNHQDVLGPLMGKKMDIVIAEKDISTTEKRHALPYRLTSIISHCGNRSSSGHYVSEVHCPLTNTWWHCNDSHVSLTTEEEVRQLHQTKAYILFYIAITD